MPRRASFERRRAGGDRARLPARAQRSCSSGWSGWACIASTCRAAACRSALINRYLHDQAAGADMTARCRTRSASPVVDDRPEPAARAQEQRVPQGPRGELARARRPGRAGREARRARAVRSTSCSGCRSSTAPRCRRCRSRAPSRSTATCCSISKALRCGRSWRSTGRGRHRSIGLRAFFGQRASRPRCARPRWHILIAALCLLVGTVGRLHAHRAGRGLVLLASCRPGWPAGAGPSSTRADLPTRKFSRPGRASVESLRRLRQRAVQPQHHGRHHDVRARHGGRGPDDLAARSTRAAARRVHRPALQPRADGRLSRLARDPRRDRDWARSSCSRPAAW